MALPQRQRESCSICGFAHTESAASIPKSPVQPAKSRKPLCRRAATGWPAAAGLLRIDACRAGC